VNNYTPVQTLGPSEAHRAQRLRLVSLCGSIKPLYSGTDDYHETLIEGLRGRQVDVRPVDLLQWGITRVPQLLRRVASEHPDIILMQYPTDAFSNALGPHLFSALQRTAPLVVTLHEFASANPIRRASLAVLLARCAAVITTADTEQNALVSWFPWLRDRTSVVPIGANFPAREWQPRERPLVVCFGQIRPEKGLEEFIACKQPLAARFPDAEFVIAGSRVPKFAAYSQTIEAEARQHGIAFLTELAPGDVPDFLRTATLALLPLPTGASFRRGSLLAAIVCGVPVVTLRGAETPPEMISLLKPVTSRDDLINQAAAYLADGAMRNAAHQHSRELAALVSWDVITDRYTELFSRLTARRSTQ
jgi:glycosyltransferase involved in cell wall biosynthesis